MLERCELTARALIIGAGWLCCARETRRLATITVEIEVSNRPLTAAGVAKALHASILLRAHHRWTGIEGRGERVILLGGTC